MRQSNVSLFVILFLFACKSYAPTDVTMSATVGKKYSALEPVSLTYLEHAANENHGIVEAIIRGVRKRLDKPVELEEYLTYLENVNECADIRNNPEWKHLVEHVQSGDSVFFFEYSDGPYSDWGLLVLRQGTIVYRTKWGWMRHVGEQTMDDERECICDVNNL